MPLPEEVALLLSHLYAELAESYLRRRLVLFLCGILAAVLGIVLLFFHPTRVVGVCLLVAAGVLFVVFATRRCKARVKRMARVHWTGVQAPLEKRSVLLDCSGMLADESLSYPYYEDVATIRRIGAEAADIMSRLPAVLPPELPRPVELEGSARESMYGARFTLYDCESRLHRLLEEACGHVGGYSEAVASLAAFRSDSGVVRFVRQQRTAGNLEQREPTASLATEPPERRAAVTDELDGVRGVAEADGDGLSVEGLLTGSDEAWGSHVAALAETRGETLGPILMSFAQRLNRALSYGEVYWYCPQCHAEVLGTDADAHRYYRRGEDTTAARLNPDARMAYDPYSETWHCPLCDLTLSDTEDDRSPIPSLRIYADLFRPVYDRLTLEHADDRAGILNHIDDQKRQYRNEEFKQLSDFHERHGRELSSIEDSLTELLAEIQADQTAIGSYVALAAKYDRMQQARADAYVRDCQRIRAEIEADARATADRISEYSDQLLEQAHVEAERRALLQNQIEECRHQELVGAVQHVAANTATMVHEQRRTNAYLRLMAPKRRFRVRWL